MKEKICHAIRLSLILLAVVSGICMWQEPMKSEAAGKMRLNKKKASLNEKKKLMLQVKKPKGKVAWSSSKPTIAKIQKKSGKKNEKAVVLGVKAGKATITARIGKKKLAAVITVKHIHKYS